VDDYGTGYSCMAYLHDLPVSYLKIDRGFTDRLLDARATAIIVASTIEMAHRLQLQVVAGGRRDSAAAGLAGPATAATSCRVT